MRTFFTRPLTYAFSFGILFLLQVVLFLLLKSVTNPSLEVINLFALDKNLDVLDPRLLTYIKSRHLFPPSKKEYNLTDPVNKMDNNVEAALKSVVPNYKSGGFFVECGANNGEYLSETIDLEVNQGWNGLLIEASPSLFEIMGTKNRKAWSSDICLSSAKPEKIEFVRHKDNWPVWRTGNGRVNPDKYYEKPSIVEEGWEREQYVSEGMVECFPFASVLAAMDVFTVDYFSLDVEGHELTILKAIPFDKVHIKVLKVEHGMHTKKDKQEIFDLMTSNAYTDFIETGTDFVFVRS